MTLMLAAVVIGLLAVLFMGMRIGIAIALVGVVCLTLLLAPPQPDVAGELIWNATKSYYLTSLPLFVFMAEVLLVGDAPERSALPAVRTATHRPAGDPTRRGSKRGCWR